MIECRNCGQHIRCEDLQGYVWATYNVWVDDTGGDVCCADKFTENNENGAHQPKEEGMEGDQKEMNELENELDVWLDAIKSIERARDAMSKLAWPEADKVLSNAAYDVRMGLLAFVNQKRKEKE